MKKAGIIILVIGLVITIFNGIKFVTRQKVADLGVIVITAKKNHELAWSPLIGAAMIVAGGCVYLFGSRKATT
jgi:hypothetical protein